ncbi:restriction endonuclease subunit S [Sorangium sp. So ce118]
MVSVAAVQHQFIDASSIGTIGLLREDGSKGVLRPGDVLIVEGNGSLSHIGRVAIWDLDIEDARHQNHIICVRPTATSPRFTAGWLASPAGREAIIDSATSATGLYTLSISKVETLPIPVPPQAEQRRIVAKLETLTAKSRRAKEALDAIPALLERFRQSVLAAAFCGDLTADWREKNPDVEPAEELLKRIRAERRRRWEEAELAKMRAKGKLPGDDRWKERYEEPAPVDASELPELPEGWTWASVEELATKVVDGVHKKPNYTGSGIPFLTVKNLTAGPSISFEDVKYVSISDHEEYIKRTYPEQGDILISKDGTLGVPRLVRTDRAFSIFVSLALVKPVLRSMGEYLELAFLSPYFQERFKSTGSGLLHIHLIDLRAAALPLAPVAEQTEVVRHCTRLMAGVQSLENLHLDTSQRMAKLNNAILAKAFRGELVPQDPRDEPASALLERLRAEATHTVGPTNGVTRPRKPAPPESIKPSTTGRGRKPASVTR